MLRRVLVRAFNGWILIEVVVRSTCLGWWNGMEAEEGGERRGGNAELGWLLALIWSRTLGTGGKSPHQPWKFPLTSLASFT